VIGFLPEIAPGELLWSAIARACDASGEVARLMLRDRPYVTSYLFPRGLRLLSEQSCHSEWNLEALITQQSIYPYFLGQDSRFDSALMNAIMGIVNGYPSRCVSNLVGQTLHHERLTVCLECLAENKEKFGFGYIQREHQLPGVICCAKHDHWLYTYHERPHCLSLESVKLDALEKPDTKLSRPLAIRIAQQSKKILEKHKTEVSTQSLKSMMVDLGWISPNCTLIDNRLLERWGDSYPEALMVELGARFTLNRQHLKNFVNAVLNDSSPVHPLWRILLESLVVDAKASDPQFDLFGDRRGDYMCCPNPLCELKQAVRLGHDQVCSNCGYHWWVSRKRAVIGKVIDRGHVWKKELQHLLDEQIPLKKIAKLLKASPENVKREALELGYRTLWKKPKERHDYTPSILDLQASRADWLKVRACYQSLSRKELRAQAPALWKWLYRNDRAWLQQNLPPARPSGRSSPDTAALFKGENA